MIRPRALNHPIVRFIAVGGTCFAASTALLVALCEFAGVNYLAAFVVSFILGNVLGYLLNGRFTFAARINHGGALRYLTVNALQLAVNSVALKLMVEQLHLWYLSATIILAAINTPASFLIHRLITFRTGQATATPYQGAHNAS